ncbi:hypothetical protein LAZ67_22001661 [Cordylochernes scorpioides]|uniref:Uncharacterized protein n=1 Tax=Cordylochernes scorpioides TaxID=51811 RepID=A0ABY6LTZ6_9ARAC|nr:hypothetical protein LAZ67_22001661 [Cordylochernes scorpioides]
MLESRGELVSAGVHLTYPLDPRHRRVRGDYSEPLPKDQRGVHLTCPLDPRHRRVRGDYSEPLPVNSD